MKDWIAKGLYKVQDILDDDNEIISFNEIEARVGPSAHRLLEYNALTSALKQAQDNNRLTPQNDNEADMEIMSLNSIPLHSLKSKDFRKLLTENTQACAVTCWSRKLQTDIDHTLDSSIHSNQRNKA